LTERFEEVRAEGNNHIGIAGLNYFLSGTAA
jgi:hypothetical protein